MKRTFSLFILISCFHCVYAQIIDFDKVVLPTPEAAHLQKEVKIPVDYSTGVPNISIPLFELSTGKISVPVSISYHASGIRVGQLSSSVGLGWGLDAGGAITRTIRGKKDDDGWLLNNYTYYFANALMALGTVGANDYMLDNYDFSQDDYSYNFLGYGGSFYFDSTKTIRSVTKDPISLEYNYPYTTAKFKAKDFSGFTYYFDSTDNSYSSSFPSNNTSNSALTGGISAWRLTRIQFQSIDTVTLDYEKYSIDYDENGADIWDNKEGTQIACVPGQPGCQTCGDDYATVLYHMISERQFDNSLVKQIKSRDTQVDFYYSNDNSATVWKRKLDSIIVKSLIDNSIKKKIFLSYSRFSGCEQLKLNGVRKVDLSTGQFEETKFVYYETAGTILPTISSRSKDMFGFFNNKSNTSLIVTNDVGYTNVFTNADRTVNAQTIMLGTLRSVTYSTGGYSEFIYEPNKIDDSTYGPGLRVKDVKEYNALDGKLNRNSYSYFGYHGQSLVFPHYMSADIQRVTYQRRYFSSDEPKSYYAPLGVQPMGYVYDSVVIKTKGSTNDLLTTYKYDYFIIYNGYKSVPKHIDYYKYDAGTSSYGIIRSEKSVYNNVIDYSHTTPLLGVERPALYLTVSFSDGNATCKHVTAGFYTQYSYVENAVLKTKEQNITYSQGNTSTEETRYYYANMDHIQPTRIVKLNSTDSTITIIKYPAEMVSSGLDPTGVYQSMINNHYWGPGVIEETLDAGSSSLTKTVTGYKQWTGLIAPELLQAAIKGATPETRKKINQYDSYGNVSEYEVDGMKNCFVWDYNGSLPVAKVSNAAISETAYTGFETSQTGGWTLNGGSCSTSYAVTGKRGYSLSSGNSITKSSLPNQDYIVSYWLKTGSLTVNSGSGTTGMTKNGWTYYEHLLTSATSITVSGDATFDDLRLYPKKAQMATYTFDPLRGLISSCDVSNRISYYEYDGMGRLYQVRDIDKNIIKKFNYSLTQAGASGIYYNWELSGSFTHSGCGTGYEGSIVSYTVPAGRYSSMISQDDANAQAQLEINNLGQAYANENGICTPICTNCPAPGKHCINGVCVRGFAVYTSSTYNPATGYYDCYYHYEFSDGFQSADIYIQSSSPCL